MAVRCTHVCKGFQPSAGRMMAWIFFIVIGATLFSGCSPATHQVKVPLAAPEQFSATGTSPLPGKWWVSFEDPVLNELMDQALANNFDLKTAWDRLSQAEALVRSAGADLSPTLDGDVDTSKERYRESGVTYDSDSYSLGLSASYEVDLWGRISSSRDAAVYDAKASREDLRTAALTLSADVAGTWYHLVEQYGQWDILNEQVAINEKILELISLQFRTGQVGIADMLQQRQLVESNKGDKTQVEAEIKVLQHQLAILLGYSPLQSVAPRISKLLSLPDLPQTGVPAALIQGRPDIRSAYYAVLSADSDLAAALANRFPRLSITAEAEISGEHTRDLFDDWLANLAANLAAPLIDGGVRKAEVDRTRSVASEALHTYGQTILDALSDVEDALAKERHQRDFIQSLKTQLKLAGQVSNRMRDRYVQGTVDYQRVLDALLSQQTLQQSVLSANRDLVQDRIDLCRALGTGWELERPEEDQPYASMVTGTNTSSSNGKISG